MVLILFQMFPIDGADLFQIFPLHGFDLFEMFPQRPQDGADQWFILNFHGRWSWRPQAPHLQVQHWSPSQTSCSRSLQTSVLRISTTKHEGLTKKLMIPKSYGAAPVNFRSAPALDSGSESSSKQWIVKHFVIRLKTSLVNVNFVQPILVKYWNLTQKRWALNTVGGLLITYKLITDKLITKIYKLITNK